MAHDRQSVLNAIIGQGVIPVFSHPDPAVCVQVIRACAAGGAVCVEFTNRGDFAAEVFAEVARHFAKGEPSVVLGVGSVVDAPTAALYLARGARFVVGPMLNAEVARLCNRRMTAYLPGCGTLSEIGLAHELGCEVVKLFPGGAVGGPEFVKAILGPMPWTKVMPTGGVDATEASLRPWFEAGIVACGLGSNLVGKALVDAGDFTGLEARVRQAIELVRAIRGAR
jgi:2-dehydro-3-deoxyphosphogluconate aldolase/(4S)-4-hydroxy-2-oxoglutarate aldolase